MANFNFNKVILGGRLTAEPESGVTASGVSFAHFSIAQRRRDGKETDFFNVSAWRGTAEFITKYFHKGSSICISGRLASRSWETEDGARKHAVEVVADEVYFVDSKSDGEVISDKAVASNGAAKPDRRARGRDGAGEQAVIPEKVASPYSASSNAAPQLDPLSSEDELPF